MITRPKLPGYSVEFLPLERRFIERREISLQLSLVYEKRSFVRRQNPNEATNAPTLSNAPRKK